MHLTLVPSPRGRPTRAGEAWLLPEDFVGAVVEGLSRRRGNLGDERLHALPIGLFVIPERKEKEELGAWGRAILYGRLAENVFAPVDAVVNATVSADEWREMFPPGAIYVWHPTAGLFCCRKDDGLRVADLLRAPRSESGDWGRAVSGTAFNARLRSLLPARAMTADTVWGGVSDEIGSASLALDTLPLVPGEWRLPSLEGRWPVILERVVMSLFAIGAAIVIAWLIASPPGVLPPWPRVAEGADPTAPTFEIPWRPIVGLLLVVVMVAVLVGALIRLGSRLVGRGDGTGASSSAGKGGGAMPKVLPWGTPPRWLLQWRQSLAKAFESRHDREIRRLIHLLNTDPDAGLRFALPLFGEAGRGLTLPASRLGEQPIDYGAVAGGAGGFMQVTGEQRAALLQRYRDLANREIVLGRHRRAAYIFARLLGDHSSAARVLLDGGHFREAAVLYDETLGRPELAAAALERGGLLSEALVLYERVGAHEKVGDLSAMLGLEEAAVLAYRRALEARLVASDHIGGARILTAKLRENDEALSMLAAGWPESPQAVACATELLKLLGDLGRHTAARDYVCRMVSDGRGGDSRARAVLGILPAVARSYPDEETRRLVADQTRLFVAETLSKRSTADLTPLMGTLMGAIAALEPGDRLLHRDTQRYAARRPTVRVPPQPRWARGKCGVVLKGETQLPPGKWTTLVAEGEMLYVAGRIDRQLAVVRCEASGSQQTATDKTWFTVEGLEVAWPDPPVLLAVSARIGRVVLQQAFGFAIPVEVTLPSCGDEPARVVGSHAAFAGRTSVPFVAGVAYGPEMALDILRARDWEAMEPTWIWERYDAVTDALLGTWQLPPFGLHGRNLPAVAFRDHAIIVGHDKEICIMGVDGQSRSIPSSGPVLRVAATTHDERVAIAASLEDGGIFVSGDLIARFAKGLHAPHCCFLNGDCFVAAGEGEIELYAVDGGRVLLVAAFKDRSLAPVAITPCGGRFPGFAILAADGKVSWFGIQAGLEKKSS